MNKKGSMFIGVIFAIFFFIFGMLMLPLMKDGITEARTNIGCSTSGSLSDGAKLMCLGLDLGVPYFIVAILTFVGGFIGNKL
jgi:uncharacterized membrane protein